MAYMYTDFAPLYDIFMDNVPYDRWAEFIVNYLSENGIKDGLIADLGCGTGVMTRLLADRGYDMTGIDSSMEMLQIARQESGDRDILYLCQELTELELYGTMRAAVATCDVINYITDEAELLSVFKLVNNYLDRDGLFIFDVNSPYKYRELLGDKTFAENREEGAFIWDNFYDEEEGINEYELTLFSKREDGAFERCEELHYERCYEAKKIAELLEKAGLKIEGVFEDYAGERKEIDEAGASRAERLVFIAREGYQEGKKYTDE